MPTLTTGSPLHIRFPWAIRSQPSLRATLQTTPGPRTVWLRATSTDGGPLVVFAGSGAVKGTSLTVDLAAAQTVGDQIRNRDVQLQWETSLDGVTYTPFGESAHRLFVLYAAPRDISKNSPTAKRIDAATRLADGQSAIMDIAQPIAEAANAHFLYGTGTTYQGESAWAVAEGAGDCGAVSWLAVNALKVIGIQA